MEYLEFLDAAGCCESRCDEEDYEAQVKPLIEDRRDLFPTAFAVASHFASFGLHGFSDSFIETLDRLTEAIREARREARIQMVPFEWLLTSAEELSL